LHDKTQKIALENRFYGYRRVCRDLWRIHGLVHILRLMRKDNLLCLRQKPFVRHTTNSTGQRPDKIRCTWLSTTGSSRNTVQIASLVALGPRRLQAAHTRAKCLAPEAVIASNKLQSALSAPCK